MKKGVIAGIVIGVFAIILGIVLAINQESDVMKIEDVSNKELSSSQESTEVQEKLEEIRIVADKNVYVPMPREWITSGPFQIDRSKYVLGEKIFLVIEGLEHQEKGQVTFLRPLNDTHYSVYQTVPFDETKKSAFNYYIQPQLTKTRGLCTVNDLIGTWKVVFRGTDYPNLEFEITDKILPGDESSYEPVC